MRRRPHFALAELDRQPEEEHTGDILKSNSETDLGPAVLRRLKRASAADVARSAGVSKATVSRVVNGGLRHIRPETRRRVLEAAHALDYRPNLVAASMRTRRTRTITLMIPDITNPFWPEVARGVQDRAAASQYAVVLANSDWRPEREAEFLSFAERSMVAGLIVNPSGPLDGVLAHGIPTVVIGSRDDSAACDVVGSDTYGGMRLATAYLVERGHRRVAFIGGLGARAASLPDRGTRLAGYRDELAARGLALDRRLVVEAPYTIEGGRVAARRLLRETADPPTAIVGANDLLAVGALFAARELGINVPDDLSLVGSDDIPLAAATWPGLTTVAKPKYLLGEAACEMLLERLEPPPGAPPIPVSGRRRILPVTLAERGTVAPPAHLPRRST